jgi:hypothetical protein
MAQCILVVLGIVAVLSGCGSTAPQGLSLRRPPYLGVACPGANSIACDRVGLAVWLVKPASRVTASVAGLPVPMRIPPGFRPTPYLGPRGGYWEGFLQPAGLRDGALRVRPDAGRLTWYGRPPLSASVRITAHYRDGSATTIVRAQLRPGWG